jgi:hypothetical protein
VFRPSSGTWFVINSSTGGAWSLLFGMNGDKPVPADFDGDGRTDIAVWRPSTGTWFVSGTAAGFYLQQWGQNGDQPVPGDYDRDGRADLTVFRPSTGQWLTIQSSNGVQGMHWWGLAGDTAIADHAKCLPPNSGLGLAIWRPSTKSYFIPGSAPVSIGLSTDIPVMADFTGGSAPDHAVFRPSNGTWVVKGNPSACQ